MTAPARAYLDHAATTPLHPAALEAMLPYFSDDFANPSGNHMMARDAMRAVNDARDTLAELFGCEPDEVVFCSGATEADNLAVFGMAGHGRDETGLPSSAFVCSEIEHPAILEPIRRVGGSTVGVDARGIIDLDHLSEVVNEDTQLVSVMLVNNEVGVIQPLDEVAEVLRQHAPQAVLHTDAVQAVSWLDVAELARPAQLISLSGHKFGGPKGAGVLIMRRGVKLEPILHGGGQEWERRAGTHNVPAIVGLAAAAEIAVRQREDNVVRVAQLRDRLADTLKREIPGVIETGVDLAAADSAAPDRSHKIAGSCHLCFSEIESELLLVLLEQESIYASAASSCASGAFMSSHVLAAMGISLEMARGSLRLSLGTTTTDAEIDHACQKIPAAVKGYQHALSVPVS